MRNQRFEYYMRELNLIKRQNWIENDLYHLVAEMIKAGKNMSRLSLRDVSLRSRSPKGQIFYGLSSFPDFVILDERFDNSDNLAGESVNIANKNLIYGCVEVKNVDEKLLDLESIDLISEFEKAKKPGNELNQDLGQLLGQILWFKKVLYTNGNIWKFYKRTSQETDNFLTDKCIEKLFEDRMKNEAPDYKWYAGLNDDNLKIEKVFEFVLESDIKKEVWEEFLNSLYSINWEG
ncbi:hypothetical protein [Enterococcus gallinarum]|uniref:Uncharacterized protein n=2 Tax=Enterococcus gallinarum TaxID=1353 RepID=A0ABD4ZXG2_ENTGA|nr:hypothetical protein [Enterococcus gallinarum]MBF0824688.1 hypothetical protein [Enterococcus faecalis]MBF0724718.1 hypothetical protein [Enterococcus gallinarum]MBF0798825.1 hypothetical protein [Enterococcus gallinarum]MBX8978489.1 hypothetical protein [Enterococcus gallinarum]MDL4883188.1 hypothetical protein [Enterococcus gallinarum]